MDPCIQDRAVGILQEQIKVANNRIADLEKIHECLMEMNGTLRVMAEQLAIVKTTVEGHEADIKTIKEAPANDYAKIRLSVVMTVIGFVLALLWKQAMG